MKTRPCRPTPLTKIQDQKEQLDLDARNSSSYFLCWLCIWTLGVFVVYFKTMHPSIPGGDSGELIAVADALGVAHPPGYPLFCVLGRVFIALLSPLASLYKILSNNLLLEWMPLVQPFTVAWRMNFMSLVFGVASASLFFTVLYRLTDRHLPTALFFSACFAFSSVTWQYAIVAEVFSLNNLFVVLLLWLLVRFNDAMHDQAKRQMLRISKWGAFLCGLSLTNQHTMILFVIPVAVWVLWQMRAALAKAPLKLLAQYAGLAFLGLSPYLYLPLVSAFHTPSISWGDFTTWDGIVYHVTRAEYGTFQLADSSQATLPGTFDMFISNLKTHIWHYTLETFGIGPILIAVSVYAMVAKPKTRPRINTLFIPLAASLVLYMAFFHWRSNLDTSTPDGYQTVVRFLMQPNIFLHALSATGACILLDWSQMARQKRGLFLLLLVLTTSVAVYSVATKLDKLDESDSNYFLEVAHHVIRDLPYGAILLVRGDPWSSSIRYAQSTEGLRPDLVILEHNLLTRRWYVNVTAPTMLDVHFPGDICSNHFHSLKQKHVFNIRMFLDTNIAKRDIYVSPDTRQADDSWKDAYSLQPAGLAQKFVLKNTTVHTDPAAEFLYHESKLVHVEKDIRLPSLYKYDAGSWEAKLAVGVVNLYALSIINLLKPLAYNVTVSTHSLDTTVVVLSKFLLRLEALFDLSSKTENGLIAFHAAVNLVAANEYLASLTQLSHNQQSHYAQNATKACSTLLQLSREFPEHVTKMSISHCQARLARTTPLFT